MGIQGLLPFLAASTRDAHISEFENQYVAVDAYCWLHKGIYSCSYEIAIRQPTTKYITYCMRYIEMLQHFKVKPILVFDGRNLSSKEETEKKRREERTRKYKKGLELMRAGKTSEGRQLLGESVDVRHELVVKLMQECRKMNIDCIVAPYEADAQLSYFSLQKKVGCIITEDSDLLVYGCDKVMFKMDKSGRGRLVEKNKIYLSLGMEEEEYNEEKFCYVCILSGCDYLPSLPSIGLANALKFVKLVKDKNIIEVLPKLPVYLNKMKVIVTPEYIERFKVALKTFKHQLVYDPFNRKQMPLTPTNNDQEIVGEKLEDKEAFQLAIGNIDPITMVVMDNFDPDKCNQGYDLLWKPNLQDSKKLPVFPSVQVRTKRQSEALFGNDLKKYCRAVPHKQYLKDNNPFRRKTIGTVPQTGFVFETNSKKELTTVKETDLLKSRYFKCEKKKLNNEDFGKGRRKNESYEEYLQRLYEEEISNDENEPDKNSASPSDDSMNKQNPLNKSMDENSLTQRLDDCLKELHEHVKTKMERCHSLLDEFSKAEKKEVNDDGIDHPLSVEDGNVTKDLARLRDLNFKSESDLSEFDHDLVHGLSQGSEKENEKTETCENSQKTPSPVFKVQKKFQNGSKSVDWKLDKIPDTACTPTSIYFSEAFSQSVQDESSHEKFSTPRKNKSFPLKLSKNVSKKASTSRTLFQFGFQKQHKNGIVDPT